ncbi:LGFP repeat-containing protein [Streptomyces platensis]|uniref:LGFP repeat-containing protein n=1 Tax=Streptomyces platensis TaxID=58346 RepID=UPI00332A3932
MTTRARAMLLKGVAVTVAALTTLTVPATSAAADETVCGHQVGGDILAKYHQIGGQGSPLGCPTSDELTTPNGRGKFNTFVGGAIYWTPETGAHPTWGAIRDKWGALGWEEGKLGFPVNDELTNPDGNGKRQQFEGGTVYWHPTLSSGAHPVWGKIGEQWGEFGREGGPFGYPTSDEVWNDSYNGYIQRFAKNDTMLFWSKGMGKNHGTC